MLLSKTVTKDQTGAVLFEEHYTHDSLGRMHTTEMLALGQRSGATVWRVYGAGNQIALQYATQPNNQLIYSHMISRDNQSRPLVRCTFDEHACQLGRVEYRWNDAGEGVALAYDNTGAVRGNFTLTPTPGVLYDISDAKSAFPESMPGPASVHHRYRDKVLEATEIRFASAQNVSMRVIEYGRDGGRLVRLLITDEPSNRRTAVELEWREGNSVLNTEDEFLADRQQM